MPTTKAAPGGGTLRWPHRGDSLEALLRSRPERVLAAPPGPDEVLARVEAVSICSSDIKVVRMGADHPLLTRSGALRETVLGHEVCLRVVAVGERQQGRFAPGQRLGLQPAMRIDGQRRTIGFDVPGGFAQMLRLGSEALADYVFPVPEELTAAEIALLEPYGCVERAWRPNARIALDPAGAALVVLGPGAARWSASRPLRWRTTTLVAPAGAALHPSLGTADRRVATLAEVAGARFDDILALGEIGPGDLAALPGLLAEGGMLLQARRTPVPPVPVDAARIHYDGLALVGTAAPDVLDALSPARQRFDLRPGGAVLVHGAGGAMGRIHVHRLLQLAAGPATVIASARGAARLADLREDFAAMAAARGRALVLTEAAGLDAAVHVAAPNGLDAAVVVAPDPAAVAEAARWLAPDGLLVIFAGFAYGNPVPLDLAGVAVGGLRITGSTGCSVADMQDVLARVRCGELDLLANLKAVAGLSALPAALDAVQSGEVSGKIVIYPQAPDAPLRRLSGRWDAAQERGLIGLAGASEG
jgi:D-arabinose 1-dehydrogenase-like Zn-dependent alcohol dehydrogenase